MEVPYFDDGGRGFGSEVRLAGRTGTAAFVGAGVVVEQRGSVIYAVDRIAALGTARNESGATWRAAYFVATDVGGSEFASGSVAAAARGERRTPINQ